MYGSYLTEGVKNLTVVIKMSKKYHSLITSIIPIKLIILTGMMKP